MKNNVIVNLILVVLSWSLYLDGMILSSLIVMAISIVLMLLKMRRYNITRMTVTFIITYALIAGLSAYTTLSDFYNAFLEYSLIVSINVALCNEMIQKTGETLNTVHLLLMIIMSVFVLTAMILPDEWYTIFTKTNIYMLICFIFFPYIACLNICLFKRMAKTYKTILN